ncbi:hypothetical protein ACFS6H_13340 [Terrimonas rubra]|uniref:Uncharacterized protein n=1 Tax=Terrimonas rubra TaxID=1035890 RepID=A0ABW6A9V1_9BACT
MEQNNESGAFEIDDYTFWENPEKHALVRDRMNNTDFFGIYTVDPILLMKLCDDFDYALRLSYKMLENGVRVFNNFQDLFEWYSNRNNTNITSNSGCF